MRGLTVAILVVNAVAHALVASAPAASASPTVHGPVITGDWPDPEIVRDPVSFRFFAFSTNVSLFGDWWNVPVRSSSDLTDWTSAFAADALPSLPGWAVEGRTWAPGVARISGRWVMYFTARHAASGRQCIGVATSQSPSGPYVPHGAQPLICQLSRGGSIDASPTASPDGTWWLTWKSDDNALGRPTHIWSSRLTADGLALAGATHHLLAAGHAREAAWGTHVIEGPDLVVDAGRWWLLYGGGRWDTASYFVHVAKCTGPAGPCTRVANPASPWLDRSSGIPGPGGASVFRDAGNRWYATFHGWRGAVGYAAGGMRAAHVEPLTFDGPGGSPRLRPDLMRMATWPFGRVDIARRVPGGVNLAGWAVDADTAAPAAVHVYVDGRFAAAAIAKQPRPDIANAYPGYGPGHGFSLTAPAPPGTHRVCTYAINIGGGPNVAIGCHSSTVP
jgi:beta-xylosidase